MKSATRLLLFVALLLPFRTVLAVTGMLCHEGSPVTSSVIVNPPVSENDAAMQEHVHHGDVQHHGHDKGQESNHTPSCSLCSSICGAPPLPSAEVAFLGLLPSGAERFAAMAPPHAEFALSGLERPPRTI